MSSEKSNRHGPSLHRNGKSEDKYKHILVLVCGDIGRSPRMQYHALSLANAGVSTSSEYRFIVSLVGYDGEACIPQVVEHPLISIHRVKPFESKILRKISWLLFAFIKVLFLVLQLIYTILVSVYIRSHNKSTKNIMNLDGPERENRIKKGRVDAILVQNPPSIPTLLLATGLKLFTGCQLIIDWHNLGFTMIAMALGMTNPIDQSEELKGRKAFIVKAATFYEKLLSQFADYNLTVTHMMADWLSYSSTPKSCRPTTTPKSNETSQTKNEKQNTNLVTNEYIKFGLSPKPTVLHDRPPSFFQRTSLSNKHSLFQRYNKHFQEKLLIEKYMKYRYHMSNRFFSKDSENQSTSVVTDLAKVFDESETFSTFLDLQTNTIKEKIPYHDWYEFSRTTGKKHLQKSNGNRLRDCYFLVTSTSWTPDEDIKLLLDALLDFENIIQKVVKEKEHPPPFFVVFITGKGPLKEYYESLLSRVYNPNMTFIHVLTLWLEPEDYPRLLGCCDLGISLHTSTSGLDLPMKVLDMFGAGLPVLAADFRALGELVENNVNGLTFTDKISLVKHFVTLFNFETENTLLSHLTNGVHKGKRWEENWTQTMMPILKSIVQTNRKRNYIGIYLFYALLVLPLVFIFKSKLL